MKARELRNKLRQLGEAANCYFPHLNAGGCGVFAAAVAKRLRDLGFHAEVVVTRDEDNDFQQLKEWLDQKRNGYPVDRETLEEWCEGYLGWFCHLGVRIKLGDSWVTYDSDGIYRGVKWLGGIELEPVGLTPEEGQLLADDGTFWNDWFNRRQIPEVRKLVDTVLSE